MRRIVPAAAAFAAAVVMAAAAYADGTETLGPPSVPISSDATRVLAAGVGMTNFVNAPNAFSVNVPAGATVRQVLLYWGGHFSQGVASSSPDGVISVNGTSVAGTVIGGPTLFYSVPGPLNELFTTYRADITSLNLVAAGANTLTISDMGFTSIVQGSEANDGAGVLVLYSLPTDLPGTPLSVRDGTDVAYIDFPSPRDTTVPQAFSFAPSATARTANLATMVGSITDFDPEWGFRTNRLRVTFDLGGTGDVTLDNPFQSNQGVEWDAVNIPITIPAGASQMTVQALSGGPGPTPSTPASFSWNAAAVSIPELAPPPPPPPPPPPGGQGCTPGYWKNHAGSWPATGYSTGQTLASVFSGTGTLGSTSLLNALKFGGGSTLTAKKQILLRAAVASLLNAAHPGVDFDRTVAEVIAQVNAALASNNATTILDLATRLDRSNNAGCPLN
jgi:hypothetical protein